MAEVANAAPVCSEEVATDLLARLLIEKASAGQATPRGREILLAKVFGVMAFTSLSTFATLVTGYQLFFSQQLFA